MTVEVLRRTKANVRTTVRIEGRDAFEVLEWVGCHLFPEADHRPDAPLPAWERIERKRMEEARQRAKEGRK